MHGACYRCGKVGHTGQTCRRFCDAECHRCKKKGHLAKVCRSGGRGASKRSARWVGADVADAESTQVDKQPSKNDLLEIHTVGAGTDKPYKVMLDINGKPVVMEIDTGAAVSIISHHSQQKLFPKAKLIKPQVQLRTYTSEPIAVIGQIRVEVRHNGYVGQHDLIVVGGNGPALVTG